MAGLGALPDKDGFDSVEYDQEIESTGDVFDIEQVVLKFFDGVFQRVSISVICLRPSCNAGLDRVAQIIERNNAGQFLNELRTLWTGPNEAHIAFKGVYELRYFIKASSAKEPADSRDAGISGRGPYWSSAFLGVLAHGPELPEREDFAILPYTLLPIEHGAGRIQLYHKCDQRKQGKQRYE
jgi:hypothetical protein